MKKTFQKTLIAAAAGVALMSAVGTASANSLLFPYFTTASGAQSVLSLSNTGTTGAVATQALHYVYNYGPTCIHYDATGSLTANDILTHSIAAPAAGGFGLAVPTDKSVPVYFPLPSVQGFLIVSTRSTATVALRGSIAIVDPSTNLVVSAPGIDNGLDTSGAGEGDFSAITDQNFPLTFLPSAIAATSWYGVVAGNQNAVINAGANWTGAATFTNNGNVYNNDEVAYSGTVSKTITCSGTIVPTDLMTAAQGAAVGTNGGLIRASVSAFAAGGTGVIMTKFQLIQAGVGAPFGSKQLQHREQAGL